MHIQAKLDYDYGCVNIRIFEASAYNELFLFRYTSSSANDADLIAILKPS